MPPDPEPMEMISRPHIDRPNMEQRIADLQALHDLERAKSNLIACGPSAIPLLEAYLCQGAPEPVFEPRRAAVEVLAALGARRTLMEYLSQRASGALRGAGDGVVRLAEEMVENAAARALAQWPTPETFEFLIGLTSRGPRTGLVDALAVFERGEAVPYFLDALEDSLAHAAACDALRRLGRRAEWQLAGAVRTPLPSPGCERPSSLQRRRAALRLLAELNPSGDVWPWLRELLDAADLPLSVLAAGLAAGLGTPADRLHALDRLLACLDRADWYWQGEILDRLRRLRPLVGVGFDHALEAAIEARRKQPSVVRGRDSAVRILWGLRRRSQGEGLPERPGRA